MLENIESDKNATYIMTLPNEISEIVKNLDR